MDDLFGEEDLTEAQFDKMMNMWKEEGANAGPNFAGME